MNTFNFPPKNLPSPLDILPRAFPGISQLEMDELVTRSRLVNYPLGTVLCHEGVQEDCFYILLDGTVDVTKNVNNLEQRKLKVLKSGDFFGEMAIMHDAPRGASVTSSSQVTVLEIDRENFERTIKQSSTMAVAMVREISKRLRQNDELAVEDLRVRASELAVAYQKLAEQDLARREFITNVAHELRTPLMAAGGFLQLLQKGAIHADKLPATIDTVARNIQQITTLVNDILFLQEMDLILPKFQPVNMSAIAHELADKYSGKAAANLLTIHVETTLNLPNVSGDPKSLERALEALVDNAIKFSPDGGEIKIALHEAENYVMVDVIDHGIGMDPERISRVFDRFYHIESGGDNLFSGIGLGLAITNQVIKQHNGKLSVESQPGLGSKFTVKLKATRVML